ncbi:putative sugar transporter STL1 [Rhizodiscina lignyota]|uniref:Sugar transporter STL1 n=1 Tax=Rhizodiscina lignyota TaxID=1504668 RepID=A0A9P4I9R0_9PEZI|nr:putative sugar transporter STL1 [Rhizodiscina lignyota]
MGKSLRITILDRWLKGRVQYRLMSLCCSLAFALYGYDAGVLGGVQNTQPFLRAIGNPTNTYAVPMVASSYVLAATVVSMCVVFIGMPLGRRGCILMGDLCVIVGSAIQASAWSLPHIIVGRIICGFGIGFISSTVPTYMAEMSIKSKERGPEVAVQCAWLISGIAVAYWIDFGFTRMDNQVSWRFPIAAQAFFAITSGAGMLCLPDTPRWYYARNRLSEGDQVLSSLWGLEAEHPNVQHMKNEILASIQVEEEEQNKLSIVSLFWDNTDLRVGRRIRISFLILIPVLTTEGINMLVYYSTRIFANIGLSDFLSQLLAAVMNTGFAIGTWPLPWLIERWGRRPIMLWTALVCFISILIFTIMIALPHPTFATQWTAVAFVILYNFAFGFGWVGCPWLYGPEIAPLKYRHIGGAAGSFGEWLFSFLTVFAGGIAVERVGWKIWIWQVVACAGIIPFVYFMCPETSGKTLEEIDVLFVAPGYKMPDALNGDMTQKLNGKSEDEIVYTEKATEKV